MEDWKDIQGFDGYQVSNEGRVKSLKFGKERILKSWKVENGYLIVRLYKDGKRVWKLVHRLVAEAFIPNPQNLPEVNHKDENKSSNIVENLEWCDRSYNINYGTRTQKCADKESKMVDQIDPITGEVIRKWTSVNECGRNGYASSAVSRCCNGLRKTHKGYTWKYAPM